MNIYEILKKITTLNFCYFSTSQQLNIRLLQTEYYEYTDVFDELLKKYPAYKTYVNIDEYNLIPERMKNYIQIYSKKQALIRDQLIQDSIQYCEKYPDEKLASNRFLKEYKEYPYRLHQNMDTILEDLYELI